MSAGTQIVSCTCNSEFQDKQYGNKKRVANHADKKGADKTRYKCTVCGKEHKVS